MTVTSVNVGRPRQVLWHGRLVETGVFKEPVSGRVALRRLNFDGDGQADLSVHGGISKAVYCYPLEHYDYWRDELPGTDLPLGVFGENLTTAGLLEHAVCLGDRFAIGSAAVVVTQPRLPCFKLGLRFRSDEMVRRFVASGRSGFYLAVEREGDVEAGDAIVAVESDANAVTVAEAFRLYLTKRFSPADADLARRALAVPALPDYWKTTFSERLSAD
jgi:MOSC domain-containing protein YiiM